MFEQVEHIVGDAELITQVRGGDRAAFGELYSRHVQAATNLARQFARGTEADDLVSEAFARVLDGLNSGKGPDTAFRAYLFTVLRHTAYDRTKQSARVSYSDDDSTYDQPVLDPDTVLAGAESQIVGKAYKALPERWQAVLWYLTVEGHTPEEAGKLLGLTANAVTSLAYRAREGLREAYLQAHLSETDADRCRQVVARLGAWTRDGLSARERATVDAHLEVCDDCRALAAELTEVNSGLRALLAPLLLGGAAAGYLALLGPTTAVVAQLGALGATTAAPAAPLVAQSGAAPAGGSMAAVPKTPGKSVLVGSGIAAGVAAAVAAVALVIANLGSSSNSADTTPPAVPSSISASAQGGDSTGQPGTGSNGPSNTAGNQPAPASAATPPSPNSTSTPPTSSPPTTPPTSTPPTTRNTDGAVPPVVPPMDTSSTASSPTASPSTDPTGTQPAGSPTPPSTNPSTTPAPSTTRAPTSPAPSTSSVPPTSSAPSNTSAPSTTASPSPPTTSATPTSATQTSGTNPSPSPSTGATSTTSPTTTPAPQPAAVTDVKVELGPVNLTDLSANIYVQITTGDGAILHTAEVTVDSAGLLTPTNTATPLRSSRGFLTAVTTACTGDTCTVSDLPASSTTSIQLRLIAAPGVTASQLDAQRSVSVTVGGKTRTIALPKLIRDLSLPDGTIDMTGATTTITQTWTGVTGTPPAITITPPLGVTLTGCPDGPAGTVVCAPQEVAGSPGRFDFSFAVSAHPLASGSLTLQQGAAAPQQVKLRDPGDPVTVNSGYQALSTGTAPKCASLPCTSSAPRIQLTGTGTSSVGEVSIVIPHPASTITETITGFSITDGKPVELQNPRIVLLSNGTAVFYAGLKLANGNTQYTVTVPDGVTTDPQSIAWQLIAIWSDPSAQLVVKTLAPQDISPDSSVVYSGSPGFVNGRARFLMSWDGSEGIMSAYCTRNDQCVTAGSPQATVGLGPDASVTITFLEGSVVERILAGPMLIVEKR